MLMTESNLEACQVNVVENDVPEKTCSVQNSKWYRDIVQYLQDMTCLVHLNDN